MRTAEVVVVGSGVMGASVAYHLAKRGLRDILVLERAAALGEGSTGKATGGFRAQFASEVNVRLSLLSRAKLAAFRDELGVDSGYRPYGYLFLARREEEMETLRAGQRVQRAAGLAEVVEVSAAEIGRLSPEVDAKGLAGGVFCPTDGFLRPLHILEGYVAGARRLGVRFEHEVEVRGFERGPDGRITTVRTSGGDVAAGWVVNAAGAWAGWLGRLAGVEVPVVPLRRQVAATVPCDLVPEETPMTIFVEDGFHFRVRDGRVLLLWPDAPKTADPFDAAFDPAWLAEIAARARSRVPRLAAVPIDRDRCWAGLYEMSPDKHALLGPVPGCENLLLVNGSSGHGVMHAPALGHLLAEIVADGAATTLDVHALRPGRFAEGAPNPVSELL